VEHLDKVICAACVKAATKTAPRPSSALTRFFRAVQLGLAFFFLWLFFYGVGQILLQLPSAFHEGTFANPEAWNVR
jgi:hypothetical protein